MTNFNVAPCGATGPHGHQNDDGLLHAKQMSGWRKATASLITAERYAQKGEAAAATKSSAFAAVKRVHAHLGLKAAPMVLLDTLGAFTQPQDWEAGRRPIVWPSNAYLMEQTGFSLSALKRHSKRLSEAGLITYNDSSNGKRWGRRDSDGVIVEAFGFDLSPLAARQEEFEILHAQLKADRALRKRLNRKVTSLRRMIRAQLETTTADESSGPWVALEAQFLDLLNMLPNAKTASDQLENIYVQFTELFERTNAAFIEVENVVDNSEGNLSQTSSNVQKLNPMEAISGPHIPTTNQLNLVTSNLNSQTNRSNVIPENPKAGQGAKETHSNASKTKQKNGVDLSTVIQACPEIAFWARNMGKTLADWNDLHRLVDRLGPMIGITKNVWLLAQEKMGQQAAAAAFALVFEKHNAGEVSSPSGYLRGIIKKAGAGELHLERSFYGRLRTQAA